MEVDIDGDKSRSQTNCKLDFLPSYKRYSNYVRALQIHANGLDAYLFVRFLWLLCMIFAPFMFVTWTILLPVDSVLVKDGSPGLERFTLAK